MHERIRSLISELQSRTATLVSAPDVDAILASLDGASCLLATLTESLPASETADPSSTRIRKSARDTLTNFQRALVYAESRLRHERDLLHHQLKELTAQRQWAEMSRQST